MKKRLKLEFRATVRLRLFCTMMSVVGREECANQTHLTLSNIIPLGQCSNESNIMYQFKQASKARSKGSNMLVQHLPTLLDTTTSICLSNLLVGVGRWVLSSLSTSRKVVGPTMYVGVGRV